MADFQTEMNRVVIAEGALNGRGTAPVTLTLAPGTRFQIVATKDGFVDSSLNATAEREGQLVSLALAAKPAVATTTGTANEPKPATKPTKPRPATRPKPSDTSKPGFDPNAVGGD